MLSSHDEADTTLLVDFVRCYQDGGGGTQLFVPTVYHLLFVSSTLRVLFLPKVRKYLPQHIHFNTGVYSVRELWAFDYYCLYANNS